MPSIHHFNFSLTVFLILLRAQSLWDDQKPKKHGFFLLVSGLYGIICEIIAAKSMKKQSISDLTKNEIKDYINTMMSNFENQNIHEDVTIFPMKSKCAEMIPENIQGINDIKIMRNTPENSRLFKKLSSRVS